MVLAVALLLVHVVEMQIFDMLHTSGLYLLRLRWLLTNKILHGMLLQLLPCCLHDGRTLLHVYLLVLLILPEALYNAAKRQ
jgi:hypothetical protein